MTGPSPPEIPASILFTALEYSRSARIPAESFGGTRLQPRSRSPLRRRGGAHDATRAFV